MKQIPRSALVFGIAGAVFFIVAGAYGLAVGSDPGVAVVFLLFVVVGVAALVGAVVLARRGGRRG